jgi:hypothetical protein
VPPVIRTLALPDPPEAWASLGFSARDGASRVGAVTIVPGADRAGWGLEGGAVAGLPAVPVVEVGVVAHPNGAVMVDHIVVATPDLQRTLAALAAAGFDLRRTRDTELGGRPLRQAFYRAGEAVLEVVGPPEPAGHGPAALWGVTITVADLDALAVALGDRLGPVHDAVQPGRRIASLRSSAGIATRLAFISQMPPARR